MLGKLLKYDLKSTLKLFLIGAIISPVAAIGGGVMLRLFFGIVESNSESIVLNLFAVFCMISGFVCLLLVGLFFFFTQILVYVRYYKNFFTDEGYLTFTLPASRGALFFSKTVSATIYFVAQTVISVLSFLLFAIVVTPAERGAFPLNFDVLAGIGQLLSELWSLCGAWTLVYILEVLLIGLAVLVYSTMLVYFCITVGSILVKRAKLLLSIGIYYAFNSILSTLSQLAIFLFGVFTVEGVTILSEGMTKNQACATFALLFLLILAAVSAVAALLYSLTQTLLDRKLNLA